MKTVTTSATLAVAFLSSMANAFWRLPCDGPVLTERADSIVNPGKVSGHLHTIMGGNGFNYTMDYEQALTSTCSTCSVTQDLSNYWTPSLFFQAKNGTFHPVKQNGALIYYLQRRASDSEKLYAFPKGFQMLAGDPMLRSYTETKEQKAINFACLDFSNPGPETQGFPNKNCPNGLRTQIFFPSCWDGKSLDSSDHKSHMAYPSGVNSGKCPDTHPRRLISIFYEIFWDIDAWKDQWTNGKWPFVLSTGDPTGYGFHGDFVNGWDIDVLQKAVDGCNDDAGVVENCPYFDFFDKNIQKDCHLPNHIHEQTTGWMDKLPGCNAIQSGPGRAVSQPCGATTVIGEAITDFADVSSLGWSYDGCAIDKLGSRTLPIRTDAIDMTVEKCIGICVSKGQSFAGLQYSNECYCGNSVAADRRGDYKCSMECAGNPDQICGGGQRLSVYKKGTNGAQGSPKAKAAAVPTPAPLKSAPSPVIGASVGWAAKGCWYDPVNPKRALPYMAGSGAPVTNAGCMAECQKKSFKYAGTEYAGQCYCGNDLSLSKQMPNADCNMACDGNKKEKCGGANRLTLFEYMGSKKRSTVSRVMRNLRMRG